MPSAMAISVLLQQGELVSSLLPWFNMYWALLIIQFSVSLGNHRPNLLILPGMIITIYLTGLTTGGPNKEHNTDKLLPKPTGRIQERPKWGRRCQPTPCLTSLPEILTLESNLTERRTPPGRALSWAKRTFATWPPAPPTKKCKVGRKKPHLSIQRLAIGTQSCLEVCEVWNSQFIKPSGHVDISSLKEVRLFRKTSRLWARIHKNLLLQKTLDHRAVK